MKSVRTHSTNLGTLEAEEIPQQKQAANPQARVVSNPAHSSFVKMDVSSTVAG